MSSVNEMSKTYQYRKVMKPLLERKRRARINKCLDELKDLMVDCLRQDGDSLNKLEKADILELTVQHIRKMKTSSKVVPAAADSFRSGFVHAANEVSRALASLPKVDVVLGTKLMTHLGHKLNEIQIPKPIANVAAVSPLNVQCDSGSYYPTILSPVSSGYGSDNESSSSRASPIIVANDSSCVWRPW